MSNPNNPFLPYLTEENDNKQNNNKAKNDNDMSKILEEGSASAVPPPAYDEIVKPQPAQPGPEYPSYPPPPFSPPEAPIRENYNQSNQSPNVPMNSNEKRGRNVCCCFGSSKRNKSCGCGWMVVLIIFIILGIVSIINNKVCNNLTLGETPENFSFDLAVDTIFQIDTLDARLRYGKVRIFQSPPSQGNSNQTVNIQVFTGSSGITPMFNTSSQNGIFQLKISQSGFSIFNIPPRCMKSQIIVNLPQQSSFPNTIQVNDLYLTMEQNTLPYQQNITLNTDDGDIQLTNITAKTIKINTKDGDISGSITSISDELNISTNDGDTELHLGNAQTPFDSKISVNTSDGDVFLAFDGGFSGNYTVQTDDGNIRINKHPIGLNNVSGTVNNGTGNLNVITDDGDIFVLFQEN